MSDLKTQVSNVLAKAETSKINFSLPTIAIGSNSYKDVKTNIDSGKITVAYDIKVGANAAKYRYTANTLFLGFSLVDNADKEALIIHECTHAACDIAKKTLLISHSEAAAYVAQCLYFYYLNEKALSTGKQPTFKSGILQAAWDASTKARNNNGSLSAKDIEKLISEIVKNPTYKDGNTKSETYDGV